MEIQPALTIFSNFQVNNLERLQRMKDSFLSFKGINAKKWVVNIRGIYKKEAMDFLKSNLNEKLIAFELESYEGWFNDTRQMSKYLDTEYILYWIEDHISLVEPACYDVILKEMKVNLVDHLIYSWWHDRYKSRFSSITRKETESMSVYSLDLSNCKIIEKSLGAFFYTISAVSITNRNFFMKIIESEHPNVKRWPKETPFDFEKRSTDVDFLPFTHAIPKFELCASIDDDHGSQGYSLISRGLYKEDIRRASLIYLENLLDKTLSIIKPSLFLELSTCDNFIICGYDYVGETIYKKFELTKKIHEVIDDNKPNQIVKEGLSTKSFEELKSINDNCVFILTEVYEDKLNVYEEKIKTKFPNCSLIKVIDHKRSDKFLYPLISIIIPNFNNAHYLDDCLESVINQSYNNTEIIIVDDCSTDNSIEIIKKWQRKDSRIKLIINNINQKVSKTRDIGIRNSTGEWITTLDSDDYYYSGDKIRNEIEKLQHNNFDKNIIVYSGIVQIDLNGNEIAKIMREDNTKNGYLFEEIITIGCAIPRDFMFSKKTYMEVGGYDYNIPLYEDWDLKIRLSKVNKFLFSGVDGIAYRRHKKGLSTTSRAEHKKWVEFVFGKNSVNLKNKTSLKAMLKNNFNLNEDLSDRLKEEITDNLKELILESKLEEFAIWGIGELTEILLDKLKGSSIYIDCFVDSNAKSRNMKYDNKLVVTLEAAVERNIKNFVLVSWNKKEVLKAILMEYIDENKLEGFVIIEPDI